MQMIIQITQNLWDLTWTKTHLLILFHEDPTSSICAIVLTTRQINGHGFNTSLTEEQVTILVDHAPKFFSDIGREVRPHFNISRINNAVLNFSFKYLSFILRFLVCLFFDN